MTIAEMRAAEFLATAILEEPLDDYEAAQLVLMLDDNPDQYMLAANGLIRLLFDQGAFHRTRTVLDDVLARAIRHFLGLSNRSARERTIELPSGSIRGNRRTEASIKIITARAALSTLVCKTNCVVFTQRSRKMRADIPIFLR